MRMARVFMSGSYTAREKAGLTAACGVNTDICLPAASFLKTFSYSIMAGSVL